MSTVLIFTYKFFKARKTLNTTFLKAKFYNFRLKLLAHTKSGIF